MERCERRVKLLELRRKRSEDEAEAESRALEGNKVKKLKVEEEMEDDPTSLMIKVREVIKMLRASKSSAVITGAGEFLCSLGNTFHALVDMVCYYVHICICFICIYIHVSINMYIYI
jgi:hypothetical protein